MGQLLPCARQRQASLTQATERAVLSRRGLRAFAFLIRHTPPGPPVPLVSRLRDVVTANRIVSVTHVAPEGLTPVRQFGGETSHKDGSTGAEQGRLIHEITSRPL